MNGEIPSIENALLEAFAAELAVAAYRVALRTSRQGAWLDLQVGLWRALAEKVKTSGLATGLGAANRGCRSYGPARQFP